MLPCMVVVEIPPTNKLVKLDNPDAATAPVKVRFPADEILFPELKKRMSPETLPPPCSVKALEDVAFIKGFTAARIRFPALNAGI